MPLSQSTIVDGPCNLRHLELLNSNNSIVGSKQYLVREQRGPNYTQQSCEYVFGVAERVDEGGRLPRSWLFECGFLAAAGRLTFVAGICQRDVGWAIWIKVIITPERLSSLATTLQQHYNALVAEEQLSQALNLLPLPCCLASLIRHPSAPRRLPSHPSPKRPDHRP